MDFWIIIKLLFRNLKDQNMPLKSILILDDDDTFRSFVSNLLESRGLNIIEARSVCEATIKLGSVNPVLAIVDYRLPESDGITWITKLREEGKNFPVVFLSGIWCDEKTFDWLRNILRVSLILQKPLLPDLFLQQIESLLPKGLMQAPDPESAPIANVNDFQTPQPSAQQEQKLSDSNNLKERMALLRQNYAVELSQSWLNLTDAINKVRNDPENGIDKNQAIHIAHKIRGTAGSVGFTQVGEIAGKLEDLLLGVDPADPLCEIVWSEIFRALPHGGELVNKIAENSAAQRESGSGEIGQVPIYKTLLVGSQVRYAQYAAKLGKLFSVSIEIADSVLSARAKLKSDGIPFDAAIVDFDCVGSKQNLFALAKEIRSTQNLRCIPLGIVVPDDNKLSDEDISYIGATAIANVNSLHQEIETAFEKIFSSIQFEKPRILIVDDDEVLTRYLTELLSSSGMLVQSLHKPIKIVSATETFNPDLILLDVDMPGLSGYDVCRILRATGRWQQLPILFLTSRSDQFSRGAAFQAGGTDFLCKPVLAEEVLARIKNHLQNSITRRESKRDQTTGTLTTNDFMPAATQLLDKAQSEGKPFTLCLLTLDNFTKLSVQHGWFSMQNVLLSLGQLLNSRFKSEDLRAHISEDSFVVALFGEDRIMAEQIINLLRNEFADIKFASDSVGNFKTIFNIGLADSPNDGATLKSLLDVANRRLASIRLSPSI
jgi:diguanylate cyclase (GGDEF)-like protein